MTLLMALLAQAAPPAAVQVPHPGIPCWLGERSWTPPGEPASPLIMFDTQGDEAPARIEHNHDLILRGYQLEQTYNFLTYHFDNQGTPLVARSYLDEPFTVSILFPNRVPRDAAAARALISAPVLCYLQKRFRAIDALTEAGYSRVWTLE
jgi:hypothetical protein